MPVATPSLERHREGAGTGGMAGEQAPRSTSPGETIRTGIMMTLVLTVLVGVIYPFVMTGVAQVLFHDQANGSLITVNGKVVGSSLIGQSFSKLQYFHPRLSAAGAGYDASNSAGTNLGRHRPPCSRTPLPRQTPSARRRVCHPATRCPPTPSPLRPRASTPTSAPPMPTCRRRAWRACATCA